MVCPATVRKTRNAPRIAQEEDKENADNGGAKPSRSKRSMAPKPFPRQVDDDELSVFEPDNDMQFDAQPAKSSKASGKGKDDTKKDEREKKEASEKNEKSSADREKDLSKFKVVDLKAELQKRGLPYGGKKDELVARLAGAMEVEEKESKTKKPVELVVGKDVSPYVGMRVRHTMGKDHRSSRGLLGTIEIIPGRGALKHDERSVSVRWDADKSDVRGPYYTGEPCDRGSGIGTEKFDLISLQEVEEEEPDQPAVEDAPSAAEGKEEEPDAPLEIAGLQEDGATEGADDVCATQPASEDKDEGQVAVEEVQEQSVSSPVAAASGKKEHKVSGKKRTSAGDVKSEEEAAAEAATEVAPQTGPTSVQALKQRLDQCKQAWTQRNSTDASSPAPSKAQRTPLGGAKGKAVAKEADKPEQSEEQSRPVRATRNSSAKKAAAAAAAAETPGKEAALTPAAKASSTKKMRSGMPTAMEPGVSLCSSAKKAAQTVDPSSQPHESVQHFRAIISRINAEKEKLDFSKPPRASTSRLAPGAPGALTSSSAAASAKEEAAAAQASKPVTWPPPPLKATGIKLAEDREGPRSSGGLTKERLSAHVKSQGKHSMLKNFSSDAHAAALDAASDPPATGKRKSGEASVGGSVSDAAARQQRAAENRARMAEEMKLKSAEHERRRKELEDKRAEADRLAKEKREREAKETQERLEAAKRRAKEDEERRIKAIQEQEERKRMEKERAEMAERERVEKERMAAMEAAKKAASSVAANNKTPTAGAGGIFGAIGSVFKGVLGTPGAGDAAASGPAAAAAAASGPVVKNSVASLKQKETADQGPTSIKIIESKNSDDSDSDDEDKKQPVPLWAQSPNLRRQLRRQIDVSPTPVFGECKKTCDLAAMFVNHQPKRRRYDKRTSSANWGDDGGASFMAEQRFEQQVPHF